jgi:hypothetical protein
MRFRRWHEVLSLALASVACSGSGGDSPGGAAGAAGGGTGGAQTAAGASSTGGSSGAGFAGSSGGTAAGTSSVAGTAGAAGSAVVAGGAAGGGSGGASGGVAGAGSPGGNGGAQGGTGGSVSAGPFSCTLVLGLFTTSQWFNGTDPGGADMTFLQSGIDATKWEAKMQKYSFAEKWADPKSDLWNLPVQNACAMNSTMPDRAVFVGFSPDTKDQPGWEKLLNDVVTNVKAKYPSVKELNILTMGRAPNNMLCPNNNSKDTIIMPYEDAAFEAVAAASNGFVKVGPKYYVPDCENSYIFANDTDYTTTASNYIAMEVATYYIAHP